MKITTWKKLFIQSSLLRLHGSLAILWLLLILPTALYWRNSILFLAVTNIYALVIAHASAHHSLLTDVQKKRRPVGMSSGLHGRAEKRKKSHEHKP